MTSTRRRILAHAGWAIGDPGDFLGMTGGERRLVENKLAHADAYRDRRGENADQTLPSSDAVEGKAAVENAMATDRQHAHDLLDQLAPEQLAPVIQLLETMLSPEDDGDSLSPAEREAIAKGHEWLTHNKPIPHEDVPAEFGLTPEDFPLDK